MYYSFTSILINYSTFTSIIVFLLLCLINKSGLLRKFLVSVFCKIFSYNFDMGGVVHNSILRIVGSKNKESVLVLLYNKLGPDRNKCCGKISTNSLLNLAAYRRSMLCYSLITPTNSYCL